jgi:hypothetical protein
MAWLFFLALVLAEAVGIGLWLRREYYPVIFNGWAVTIYAAIAEVDLVLAWLVSMLQTPGGTEGTLTFAIIGAVAVALVFLFTLFLRWVIGQDLGEPPPK